MIEFNEVALNHLIICKDKIDREVPSRILDNAWLATSPDNWFKNFNTNWNVSNLPKSPLNRYELLKLIDAYRNTGDLDKPTLRMLIVSVFAWGGMGTSGSNGKLAIDTIQNYEEICLELLNGMSSVDAYANFYQLKNSGKMRGIRPAYYTKLIFFFGDQSGLIMDQWTARSTNLLLGKKIIRLDNKSVSDNNSDGVYVEYLNFVVALKNRLGIETLPKTEELIFSCPHKKSAVKKRLGEFHQTCSAWRKFVAENT